MSVLDNWHQDATFVEVAERVNLKQIVTPCAWCGKKYFVVLDVDRTELRGHRICSECGQFFGFHVHGPQESSRTWRARGRAKNNKE